MIFLYKSDRKIPIPVPSKTPLIHTNQKYTNTLLHYLKKKNPEKAK